MPSVKAAGLRPPSFDGASAAARPTRARSSTSPSHPSQPPAAPAAAAAPPAPAASGLDAALGRVRGVLQQRSCASQQARLAACVADARGAAGDAPSPGAPPHASPGGACREYVEALTFCQEHVAALPFAHASHMHAQFMA